MLFLFRARFVSDSISSAIGRPLPSCGVTEGQAGHVPCNGGLGGLKSKETDNVLAHSSLARNKRWRQATRVTVSFREKNLWHPLPQGEDMSRLK